MKALIEQIIKFGIVGVIAFAIDSAFLYIFTDILGIHYFISSILSFIISLIANYILSMKYVFTKSNKTKKEFTIFIVLSIIGLGINQICMYLFTDIINFYYMISKIGATIVVMVWNFVSKKLILEKLNNK